MDHDVVRLKGILPVLPTPFDTNGAIDCDAARQLVDFAIRSGVDGMVFPGFASEVSELTSVERCELLEIVVDRTSARVPVIAGATADTAQAVIEHGTHAKSLGLNFLMVQPPVALGNEIEPVRAFFAEIADALPEARLILQNAPAPRGSDLSAATISELIRCIPQITYIKEETLPAGPSISAILTNSSDNLHGVIGGGGARYILDEYQRGACAAMPALEIADLHVVMDRAWREGRLSDARKLYVETLPLLTLQAVYRMYLTKHVLMRRGVLHNTDVRAPTPKLDMAAIADIDSNLAELGLIASKTCQPVQAS